MKVVVDGVDANPSRPVHTWEQLLSYLDQQCAARGVVVTDVSFDGVVEPSFRSDALARRVVAGARIDVATATQADLLCSAIDDAVGAAAPLRAAALDLSGAFRTYEIERGNRDIAAFANGLGSLFALTGNITALAGSGRESAAQSGNAAAGVDTLVAHIETLIEARAGQDWVAVADVLEHDIVTAIDQCAGLLGAVRRALPDAGVTP